MKKIIISERQISFVFLFALFFLIITALISAIGHHWGFISYNGTFDLFRNNILMYVLLPVLFFVKILQLIGVLPRHRPIEEIYMKEDKLQTYRFIKYGRVALTIAVIVILLFVFGDKLINQ